MYFIFQQEKVVSKVKELFPFMTYFDNAPQPLFKGRTYEEDMDIAEGCFRHLKKIFTQLEVRVKTCLTIYISSSPHSPTPPKIKKGKEINH